VNVLRKWANIWRNRSVQKNVSVSTNSLKERTRGQFFVLKFEIILCSSVPLVSTSSFSVTHILVDYRTVAVAFFELLVLKSNKLIDLQQDEPYGDIIITKTVRFLKRSNSITLKFSCVSDNCVCVDVLGCFCSVN
jgi:chromatin segregation and condensation protein Rec8/ScpA/Scc1 (kleisin family)